MLKFKKSPQTIADYMSAYKKIEGEKANVHASRTLKIALLSSFTVNGIKEVLDVKCYMLGITLQFYETPYKQFAQDILRRDSQLYKFKPDLTILYIDTIDLLGEDFFFPYRISDERRKTLADEKYKELSALVRTLTANSRGKIVLHNLKVPCHSPLGILENKQKFGFFEMIRSINNRLSRNFKNSSQVFIFDYDMFCSKHGKRHIIDNKMYYLGDIKLGFDSIPLLCEEYMSYIKPMMSFTKKCLVLDLDNTLWGGVIGEDGIEGIRLGPTPEGRPFLEFQKYILNLFERGVVLAINSSNNPEDVKKVFSEHPYMILKEEHFAAVEINWNDKISNMKSIAEKINIGLDALVFIDDDKANKEIVRAAIPEVYVFDLPEDPSDYTNALMEFNDFNTLQLTEEDKNRNRLYAAEKHRKKHKERVTDITQYLKDLEMAVTIAKACPLTIPRISQLTQKTNQFNMTTKRYMEEDIKRLAEDDSYLVISIKVEDKFGDNGITGVVIIEKYPGQWRIDTFLLSCRVLGREIEKALLAVIIQRMQAEGCTKLIGEFIPTPKNTPAKDFYPNNNFKLISSKNADIQKWELAVTPRSTIAHDFITIVNNLN